MKKSVHLIISFAFSVCSLEIKAQLAVGVTAPNWIFTDIKGVSHTLYDYLDQGKVVAIDISATWCAPCWDYHNTHAFKDFYTSYSSKAMAFLIEADKKTNTACLSGPTGCNSSTKGNWVSGTPYPIINPPDGVALSTFYTDYKILTVPAIYLICPDKKIHLASRTPASKVTFTKAELKAAMDQCQATTSVTGVELDFHTYVFPNPSEGNVFVDISTADLGLAHIKVYDFIGALMSETSCDLAVSKQFDLNLGELPNGLYFIEVIVGNVRSVEKIMLIK